MCCKMELHARGKPAGAAAALNLNNTHRAVSQSHTQPPCALNPAPHLTGPRLRAAPPCQLPAGPCQPGLLCGWVGGCVCWKAGGGERAQSETASNENWPVVWVWVYVGRGIKRAHMRKQQAKNTGLLWVWVGVGVDVGGGMGVGGGEKRARNRKLQAVVITHWLAYRLCHSKPCTVVQTPCSATAQAGRLICDGSHHQVKRQTDNSSSSRHH